MPILAAMLVGLFAALSDVFVRWVSKRVAFGLSAVAVFGVLTAALVGGAALAVGALAAAFPEHGGLLIGAWLMMHPLAVTSIAAVFAADAAVALYKWNVENLRLMAYIT